MPKLDPEVLHKVTKRGVAEIIPEAEFIQRLEEGKPLKLKMGFDPSRPDLHLGHVVGLRKLRQIQDLGHELILIVGDWTARIGDPSGQSDTRSMLDAAQVKDNAETYMRQFFRVVDRDRTRAVYQSEWFENFTLATVIELTAHFTINQFLHRDDFAARYAEQRPIAVTEMLYPLMQAYDSVAIQADVEFGGTDQKFNLLVGRELQEKMGQRPQIVFTMPILPGTDGVRRMGKSLGNYIAIEDTPTDMFGKIMSLPDDVVALYFELLTDMPDDELSELRRLVEMRSVDPANSTTNPMEFKKRLGVEMVSWFHSSDAAEQAKAEFERVFQQREQPTDVEEFLVDEKTASVKETNGHLVLLDAPRFIIEAGLAKSRSEARRLVFQGAVELDGVKVTEEPMSIGPDGGLLKVGSRRYVRIVKG